jgi:hypothetical protein
MLIGSLTLSADEFAVGTGWEIKPEGACKGEVCVPLGNDDFDLSTAAARLGMALVRDERNDRWALGPESVNARALTTATAPELVLDDIDGNKFCLSSLRGKKVVIVSWAPY